jgi:cupin 2 domain-containing protein
VGNLFDDLPTSLSAERVDVLVQAPGLTLERIVSIGHATPPGEWYDQTTDEWAEPSGPTVWLALHGQVRSMS